MDRDAPALTQAVLGPRHQRQKGGRRFAARRRSRKEGWRGRMGPAM
jgi:hypothetical protein